MSTIHKKQDSNQTEDDDIKTLHEREKMLKLREELLAIEEERLNGSVDLDMDEAFGGWEEIVKFE